MRFCPRSALLIGLWLLAAPLSAAPLWSVEGEGGPVLLLGSVHLLRTDDQPLPAVVHEAYRRAARIVMELDPRELDAAASQAALQKVGVSDAGASVAETLTSEEWRLAESLASEAGLDLQAVSRFEPWFAALALYNQALAAAGYQPSLGVELQLAGWAASDGKPISGLETMEEQLLLFKSLAAPIQRQMLLKMLADLPDLDSEAGRIIAAWRGRDSAALARILDEDFRGFEALRDTIVSDRNRAWVPAVEALLAEEDTSLVAVGTLHLVGPEGLPALLEARGYTVTPLDLD
jgi:uncharacterized protein